MCIWGSFTQVSLECHHSTMGSKSGPHFHSTSTPRQLSDDRGFRGYPARLRELVQVPQVSAPHVVLGVDWKQPSTLVVFECSGPQHYEEHAVQARHENFPRVSIPLWPLLVDEPPAS